MYIQRVLNEKVYRELTIINMLIWHKRASFPHPWRQPRVGVVKAIISSKILKKLDINLFICSKKSYLIITLLINRGMYKMMLNHTSFYLRRRI